MRLSSDRFSKVRLGYIQQLGRAELVVSYGKMYGNLNILVKFFI